MSFFLRGSFGVSSLSRRVTGVAARIVALRNGGTEAGLGGGARETVTLGRLARDAALFFDIFGVGNDRARDVALAALGLAREEEKR